MSPSVDGRRRSHSRRTLVLLLSLTMIACGLALWTFRREAQDGWLLWRLDSSDNAVRSHAAARLADRRSLRAVRHLIDQIAGDERETITWSLPDGVKSISGFRRGHPEEALILELTPLLHALYRLGPEVNSAIHDWLTKLRKVSDLQKVARGFDLECHFDLLRKVWESPPSYDVTKVEYSR